MEKKAREFIVRHGQEQQGGRSATQRFPRTLLSSLALAREYQTKKDDSHLIGYDVIGQGNCKISRCSSRVRSLGGHSHHGEGFRMEAPHRQSVLVNQEMYHQQQ